MPDSRAWTADFNPAQVKAVFVYNLASFAEWPQAAGDLEGPFVIAVLGDDEIGRNLKLLVKGEQIQGQKVVVKSSAPVVDVGACRILFVGSRLRKQAARIAKYMRSGPPF